MSSIDERIVELRFRNGQFEKGIATTSASLKQFKNDLNFQGAGKSLEQVGNAAGKVDVSGIGDAVDKINNKFSLLGIIGGTAVAKVTSMAMDMGGKLMSNVLDPIIQGGERRALNIEQAKFMLEGLKIAWEDIVPAINYAVDGTAYGLDEAAKAASSLAASGVGLDKMDYSLRAISGVAAMTNSSFDDMSAIFTTVAGNGRVMASEMNRIGQRGINAWAPLAEHIGVTEAQVRDLVSKGLVDFDTFAAAMDSAFGAQATKANETYTGALANVRSALARIGEPLARGKFEKQRLIFNALIPILKAVQNAMMPLLESFERFQLLSGKRITTFLEGLDLAWVTTFFDYINQGVNHLMTIFYQLQNIVTKAWAEVFPTKDGGMDWLVNIAKGFRDLTAWLRPSAKTLEHIRDAFTGVFIAVRTVWNIFQSFWEVSKALFGVLWELVGVLFDFIKPLFETEKETGDALETFEDFAETLEDVVENGIEPLIDFLGKLRDGLQELRAGGSSGWGALDGIYNSIQNFMGLAREGIIGFFTGLGDAIQKITQGDLIGGLKAFFDMFRSSMDIKGAMDKTTTWVKDFFGGLNIDFTGFLDFIKPISRGIGDVLTKIAESVADFVEGITLKDAIDVSNVAVLLYGMFQLSKVIKSMNDVAKSLSGMLGSIGGFFAKGGVLDTHLASIRTNMRMQTFLMLAVGIGILVGALWLLSTIPTDKLISGGIALGSIAAGLMLMSYAIYKMSEKMTPEMTANMHALSGVIFKLALAIGILAVAMWLISKLSWDEIAKGLVTVISLLLALGATSRLMATGLTGVVAASFAMNILAAALITLSIAIWIFGNMDTDVLIKGGISIAIALAALTAAMSIMGSKAFIGQTLKAAFGIAIVVGTLLLLAKVIDVYAAMKWEEIESGVQILAGALAVLVGVMLLLGIAGSQALAGAAGVAILAGSLLVLAVVLKIMSTMDPERAEQDAKLLMTVIGILALVAGMLGKFDGIKGAATVAILAGSLLAIAVVLKIMEGLDPGRADQNAMLLVGTIGVLALLAVAISDMKDLKGAVTMAILVGVLAAVAAVLWVMEQLDLNNSVQNAILLLGVIVVLALVASALDKVKTTTGVTTMAILVGVLAAVAAVLWVMQDMDLNTAVGNAALLVGVIVGLALVAGAIDQVKMGSGVAVMLLMVVALAAVAAVLYVMNDLDVNTSLANALILVLVIAALALIAQMINGIDAIAGAVAIVILVGALWLLGQTLMDLSAIPTENLWQITLVMIVLMAAIAGIAAVFAVIVSQFPLAIVAVLALALVIAAVALVIFAFTGLVEAITELIPVLVSAFETFIARAPEFANAMGIVAQAAAENSQYFWDMIGMAIGLGTLGAAAIVLGIGLIAMGVGMMIMSTYAESFVASAPLFVEAITTIVEGLSALAGYAIELGIVALALGAFGIAAMIAGVGLVVLGVGLVAMGLALMVFAMGIMAVSPAIMMAIPSLDALAQAAIRNQDAILPLLGLSAGLAAFAIAALAAGVGALFLGVGLTAMGIGLLLIANSGVQGAEALMEAMDLLKPLWKSAPQMAAAAAIIAAVGLALVVFGGGALIAAVGGIALVAVVLLLTMILPLFVISLQLFADSFPGAAEKVVSGMTEMATGISGSANLISSAIMTLVTIVNGAISQLMGSFLSLGTQAGQSIATGLGMGLLMATMVVVTSILRMIQMGANAAKSAVSMFRAPGTLIGTNIAMGLMTSIPLVIITTKGMMTMLVNTIRGTTPKVMATSLMLISSGFVVGVRMGMPLVTMAGRNVGTAFNTGLRMGLAQTAAIGLSGGYSAGTQLARGFELGILDGRSRVINAAAQMAGDAVKAANDKLDVKSPSRVFRWIGQMVGAGFSGGMNDSEKQVVGASEGLGLAAIRAAEQAAYDIHTALDGAGDISPIITPTLDLTEVRRNAGQIQRLMGDNRFDAGTTRVMAQSYDSDRRENQRLASENEKTKKSGSTFNQYNYSPRSLSTTEIYRKTKSIVGKAKKTEEDQ